ncbi:MAG: FixH family protein [Cyclobacteriaceae bacterium]
MNWGWRIALAYMIFVVLTLTMVFLAMRMEVNLVTDDYYSLDLEYQNQLDRKINAQKLDTPMRIEQKNGQLSFTLPDGLDLQNTVGEIHMFRPSDYRKDKKMKLDFNKDRKQFIPLSNFETGLWKVKISWSNGAEEYFVENNIIIN